MRISARSTVPDDVGGPGSWLTARASLRPPPAPAEPGAWDFARQAWFQRIGAVGFVYGAPAPMAAPEGEGGGLLSLLSQARHRVSARILAHTAPSAGPFATALPHRRSEFHRQEDAERDAGFRPCPSAGDLGAPCRPRRRVHLLRRTRPAGADRAGRAQDADQEVGGGMRTARRCGLSAAIRHERADTAGVPHGFCRAARDHAGPREPFNAPDRLGGAPGACDRAREHARAELPDVLRCGDCADRDLRSGAWHLRPPGGARRSRAPPPRLRGRRVAHLPGRWHRHRPVRGLPLQPYRRLRPPRQSGRSADHRLLDHALGAGCASAHAVRARRDSARSDGVGNRRGGVDRPPGGRAAGGGHARSGNAGGGPACDRGWAACGSASGEAAGAFSASQSSAAGC